MTPKQQAEAADLLRIARKFLYKLDLDAGLTHNEKVALWALIDEFLEAAALNISEDDAGEWRGYSEEIVS